MPESPELLMGELLRLLPFRCCVCGEAATRTMYSEVLLTNETGLFCDEHGAGDSERFHNLTSVTFEDLSQQAPVVRRCKTVRVMPERGAVSECDYHGAVEGFCQVLNERLNHNIKEGSTWVRVKPPSREELDAVSGGVPRLMPFTRPGSLAKIESIHYLNSVRMVDVEIGGDMATYELEAFKRAFIQAVSGDRWHLDQLEAFR
jgi:hypothetical protein